MIPNNNWTDAVSLIYSVLTDGTDGGRSFAVSLLGEMAQRAEMAEFLLDRLSKIADIPMDENGSRTVTREFLADIFQ